MKNLSYLTRLSHIMLLPVFFFLAGVIFIAGSFAFYSTHNDKASDEKLKVLQGIKSYTLELAEAMPANQYAFGPHDSIRSFGEQMAHRDVDFLFARFIHQ